MSEPASRRLRLTVPARAEYLVLGRLVMAGIARTEPIADDALSDLKLALTEACSNSIRHAYAERPGTVEIVFDVGDSQVAVEVLDDGPGFEPVASTDADGAELDEGGLGLAIIRALCDEVEVGPRADGSGSCVRFARRRN